jgi:hypothetical protein
MNIKSKIAGFAFIALIAAANTGCSTVYHLEDEATADCLANPAKYAVDPAIEAQMHAANGNGPIHLVTSTGQCAPMHYKS